MGGTNILKPLQEALSLEPLNAGKKKGYKKLIFLLTDGETDDKETCIELAGSKRTTNTSIHTFGVGNDCDKKFLMDIAMVGDGICEILPMDEVNQLRKKVVEVLGKTLQPSLKEVKTAFTCTVGRKAVQPILHSSTTPNAKEIYRHMLYSEFFIVSKDSYQKSKDLGYDLSFVDPFKGVRVSMKVGKEDFTELPESNTLSKVAAHYMIMESQDDSLVVKTSIKYQVLCKSTAIVGVVKEKKSSQPVSSLEMKKVTVTLAALRR